MNFQVESWMIRTGPCVLKVSHDQRYVLHEFLLKYAIHGIYTWIWWDIFRTSVSKAIRRLQVNIWIFCVFFLGVLLLCGLVLVVSPVLVARNFPGENSWKHQGRNKTPSFRERTFLHQGREGCNWRFFFGEFLYYFSGFSGVDNAQIHFRSVDFFWRYIFSMFEKKPDLRDLSLVSVDYLK